MYFKIKIYHLAHTIHVAKKKIYIHTLKTQSSYSVARTFTATFLG